MLQKVILDRFLFDFLLSLDLVLVQVVGHSAVVLVRSCNGWLFNFLNLRVHLVNGLLDVRLHEVLVLSRGQLVDVDGFGDGALDPANLRIMLLMVEVVDLVPIPLIWNILAGMSRWSSLAALGGDYLLGRILGCSILYTVSS